MSGYVMQSDALFPLLTVRETLRYAAYFRISNKSSSEKDRIVDDTINLLRLESAANTIVGNEMHRGISGGQKRRVSIGVDIIHQPKIIFLDEPTSGLDSSTAYSIVESLKKIAQEKHSTVVMTIHQPSAKLFALLDKVMFLSMGKVTYFGAGSALTFYIDEICKESKIDITVATNPPELFLDICETMENENRIDLLTEKYALNVTTDDTTEVATDINIPYANNAFVDFLILSHRALTNIMRTQELFFARLFSAITFGVMIGTLYLFEPETVKGVNHQVAYFVFTCAFFYWTSLEALPIFNAERETFQREFSSGAYRAGAYTVSTIFVFIPFYLIIAIVYGSISYFLVGFPYRPDTFFFHLLTLFTVLVTGSTFSTMFSTLIPDPMTAQSIGSALFAVMFLFSGFFIRSSDIPNYWIYLHYLSLFKYAYDSFVVNVFEHTHVDGLSNSDLRDSYGVDGVNKGRGVGVLFLFVIFFRWVFYYRLITAYNGSRKT
jgi:ATP-binding cassette subfamily G (WHITE) protein 2